MRISTLARRLLAIAVLTPAITGASLFHLSLKRTEPTQGASVASAPTMLKLWFTETPELAVTKVSLATARGTAVALGKVGLGTSDGTPIVVPISTHLAKGAYTVTWSTMAHDGHPAKGSYGFTVTR